MKRNILLFLLAGIILCSLDVFAQPTGSAQIISSGFGENLSTGCPRLQVIVDMLYAPGPNGIMRRSKGEITQWEPFAMQGINVVDFRISGDEIIAVIIPEEYSHITGMDLRSITRLVKGTVSGDDFIDITPKEMEYSYRGEILTYLSAMSQHPTDKNCVMIMGYAGIMKSNDFGKTWEILTQNSPTYNAHSFLGWHPQKPDILFLTSESPLCVGTVWRSIDGGITWDSFTPNPSSESCCHCMAFDPNDANHLLISGGYAIYESFDCGETWDIILDEMDNVNSPILGYSYNIMYDPTDSNHSTIYAVGHFTYGAQRNVARSIDNGKTWQQCMTYDNESDDNFYFDATIFDGKIWIYDYQDIVYWNISGINGVDDPIIENSQLPIYYNLNGLRLNSKPKSGLVIEKRGETSKIIML